MKGLTQMELPLPDNTAELMTGDGAFGSIGTGGTLSIAHSARGSEDQRSRLIKDTRYGAVAHMFTGELLDPARFKIDARPGPGSMPSMAKPAQEVEVKVRKPVGGHSGH